MTIETKLRFCDTTVTAEEFALIKEMTEEFWGISRTELAETLCELLEWKRPGPPRRMAGSRASNVGSCSKSWKSNP